MSARGSASDRLLIVCTGRGAHRSRDLGLIDWTPAPGDGVAIWDASADLTQHRPKALAAAGRTTNAGSWRPIDRSVQVITRTDGGQTFRFPACPACGRRRPPAELRDDTLTKIRRVWPSRTLDVSLIG